VSANKILATAFAYLVDERAEAGCVIKSVATTRMIDAIANSHGLKVFETPVGFKHIAEVMLHEQTIMAGEESGGFTMGEHVPEKDGILANLLVCEMIARQKKPLSAIIKDASKKYGNFYDKRINLKLTTFAKETLMESLGNEPPARAAGKKLSHIVKADGVKMVFEDGSWILARPSGTEPIVRTYYESDSEEKLKEMVLNFESYISSVIGI
jgi:phosphomannomutase